MLPDLIADSVTDAAKRLGYAYIEQVFRKGAEDAGYHGREADDRARALHRVWCRDGYDKLPDWFKDFVLRVCGGEVHS